MNKSAIFNAGEIIRYYRESEFLKIPRKKLIPIFTASNGKEDREMLENMERHFRGEQFFSEQEVQCPKCECYHKVMTGKRVNDVPFCVTESIVKQSKPFKRFQIWVQRVAEG